MTSTYVLPTNQSAQQRSTCYLHLKHLLSGGRLSKALDYARKHQIADSEETIHQYLAAVEEERTIRRAEHERAAVAREEDNYRRSQDCAETEVLAVTLEEVPLYGNWPETAEVTIVGTCLNPKLLRARLADGRACLLWRGFTRNAKEGLRFMARIETFRGEGDLTEVIYERV